jgi:outer membrane lipoprotein-sorting protein
MSQRRSRPAVLAVLTAALLLTSGIAGFAVADTPSTSDAQETETQSAEEVIDAFTERISTLETAQFTRTTESTFQNETTRRTIRVYADLEAFEKRTETVQSSVGSNTTTVVNESTSVTYNEDENTVTEYESLGHTLLPTVETLANESMLDYDVRGTEIVDGQETYVLDGAPEQMSQSSNAELELTLYVDTETQFPVQIESERTSEKYAYSSTITYDNVTLNEKIPESTFELDVPDDATNPSESVGFDISEYDSHDELVSAANLSVPSPEIAQNYSFEEGRVIDGETLHSVTVRYSNGTETIGVNTRPASDSTYDYSDSDMYETVDIGETTGYLFTSGEYTTLHWETDQSYSLYGEISNETAIDVAASITDE